MSRKYVDLKFVTGTWVLENIVHGRGDKIKINTRRRVCACICACMLVFVSEAILRGVAKPISPPFERSRGLPRQPLTI